MKTDQIDLRYGLATFMWTAAILWGAATPNPPDLSLFDLPMVDKMAHFGAYAFLCWLATMSLRKATRSYRTRTVVLVPILFSLALGILTERIQTAVEYRSCEMMDFVADMLGALSVQTGFICMELRPGKTEATK